MKKSIKSNYFYGNKISEYGLQHGYVDYSTLAKAGDCVLCNDITKLFYNSINHEYIEPEQVNGYIDNSEEIEELEERREAIEDRQIELIKEDLEESQEYKELQKQFEELDYQIKELEEEQETQQEIYQYYIISDSMAEMLKIWTNEVIYYIDFLGVYVWGVTHYGTSWDYVLTNIKIEKGE